MKEVRIKLSLEIKWVREENNGLRRNAEGKSFMIKFHYIITLNHKKGTLLLEYIPQSTDYQDKKYRYKSN